MTEKYGIKPIHHAPAPTGHHSSLSSTSHAADLDSSSGTAPGKMIGKFQSSFRESNSVLGPKVGGGGGDIAWLNRETAIDAERFPLLARGCGEKESKQTAAAAAAEAEEGSDEGEDEDATFGCVSCRPSRP
ncbi:hypothetical protein MKZ38_001215 [Zalerion maritima]|uniref:Uncharacterized protein n=1 Tax=Zalerion maritima TaxID=339359 RepID=A0AAD5WY37_9PEZI|nr:hypothetical protein MKZ38_001215 [Zalerion maritima]